MAYESCKRRKIAKKRGVIGRNQRTRGIIVEDVWKFGEKKYNDGRNYLKDRWDTVDAPHLHNSITERKPREGDQDDGKNEWTGK